jgi:acyl carrier protein
MTETLAADRYDDIKLKIRDFILANLAERRGVASIADDDSLLETGVVDSLGIFLIVTFLEETFHVGVADDEITPDNFRSLAVIAQMVQGKLLKKVAGESAN